MPSELDWKLDTKDLDRIIKDADTNADKIVRRLAFKGAGYAKQNAPVATSALVNSIYVVTNKSDDYASASGKAMGAAWKKAGEIRETEPHPKPDNGEARFGPCVNYAEYQEYGTSKMAAHPFMTPAFEKLRKEFQDGTTYREMVDPSVGADNDWLI